MDYSAYTQQQQLQLQQQQQYSYEYDPSQIQAYDQSYAYQSYYAYNPQYAAAYYPDPNQAQFPYQQESLPVHPPGVNPTPLELAPQRPAHAPTTIRLNFEEIGQSQYRGRGGRGGRGNRGGGRGHFSRGRGRGRHFPSHSSGPSITNAINVPAAAETTLVVQPSSSVSEPSPKRAQVSAAPVHPPPPKAWCEICNVGCNTFEVLEQHKNGKKHQKNVKAHELLQRQKAINGQQNEQIPTTQGNATEQPKIVQESEKKGGPTENMASEATAVNHKDETVLQNIIGETSAVPAEESAGNTGDNPSVTGRGLKRKTRGGKTSKLARSADGSRRPVEPRKAEQFIPFICELCNAKCESEHVYQSHVTGKKHLSNLKRVHGPQALTQLTGLLGLQPLYPPPDINALSNAINAQVQQGDNDPQVLLAQLLVNVLSQAQGPFAAPPAGPVAAQMPAAPAPVAGTSYDPQLLQTQVSALPTNAEAPAFSNISSQVASGSFEPQQQVLQQPQDVSSVMTLADNSGAAGAASDQMPSACEEAPTS